MLFTLPFTIYLWIQQQRLAEGQVACSQCGEPYPKTNSSCPMCGCANSEENSINEKPKGDTLAAAKS
jgi:predicted amidophosphoribosyltransferase